MISIYYRKNNLTGQRRWGELFLEFSVKRVGKERWQTRPRARDIYPACAARHACVREHRTLTVKAVGQWRARERGGEFQTNAILIPYY